MRRQRKYERNKSDAREEDQSCVVHDVNGKVCVNEKDTERAAGHSYIHVGLIVWDCRELFLYEREGFLLYEQETATKTKRSASTPTWLNKTISAVRI